jgi:hypothetical protein
MRRTRGRARSCYSTLSPFSVEAGSRPLCLPTQDPPAAKEPVTPKDDRSTSRKRRRQSRSGSSSASDGNRDRDSNSDRASKRQTRMNRDKYQNATDPSAYSDTLIALKVANARSVAKDKVDFYKDYPNGEVPRWIMVLYTDLCLIEQLFGIFSSLWKGAAATAFNGIYAWVRYTVEALMVFRTLPKGMLPSASISLASQNQSAGVARLARELRKDVALFSAPAFTPSSHHKDHHNSSRPTMSARPTVDPAKRQIPGAVNFSGCRKCGSKDHLARACPNP